MENVATSQPEDALQVWREESVHTLEQAGTLRCEHVIYVYILHVKSSTQGRESLTDHNRGGEVDKGVIEVCQEVCDVVLTVTLRGFSIHPSRLMVEISMRAVSFYFPVALRLTSSSQLPSLGW